MALFEWSDKYSVNINEIDNQHKKIINIINGLHYAMKEGKGREALASILQSLIDYTKTHFTDEERLMNINGYPEFSKHRAAHENLVKQVLDFQQKFKDGNIMVSLELAGFLKDWLSKHILETDKKYAPFLNSKGIM